MKILILSMAGFLAVVANTYLALYFYQLTKYIACIKYSAISLAIFIQLVEYVFNGAFKLNTWLMIGVILVYLTAQYIQLIRRDHFYLSTK